MEPEPEPGAEEGEPPENIQHATSAYQEYIKHGISAAGLRHVATEFQVGARHHDQRPVPTVHQGADAPARVDGRA